MDDAAPVGDAALLVGQRLAVVAQRLKPQVGVFGGLLRRRTGGGAARVDPAAKRPSIEALFHAWLLTLDGVDFVGHVHPVACNQWLCSPRARELADERVFPDEVVCCGPASVFIPYSDPGLPLALAIRERTRSFIAKLGIIPRIILLENHGVIALGATPQAVLGAMLMVEKAASIRLGAAALGGPQLLTADQIASLAGRRDEAYRQRQLQM